MCPRRLQWFEAGVRALGMRHFDVQLIGGMALNDGKIAEMRTGEGKRRSDPPCLPQRYLITAFICHR